MYYIEGKYPFLLFMLAAVIHEFGHVLAIKTLKGKIKRVDIMPLCARIVTSGTLSHKRDMAVFLCGPAANIIVFFMYLPFLFVSRSPYIWYFALVNLFLAVLNLLPIPGNDGYRALEAMLKNKSDEETAFSMAKRMGNISNIFFFVLTAASVVLSGFNPGVTALAAAANLYKKD